MLVGGESIVGVMKNLAIEPHNAPNLIKYLNYEIEMLKKRMDKIKDCS